MHTIRIYIVALVTVLLLVGCGSYGVTYPKPTYKYVGESEDPVLSFTSDFGTATNFLVKIKNARDEPKCLVGTERVAFLQEIDSYFRHPELPGPWKISAPANNPILIASNWFMYGTETVYPGALGGMSMKTITPSQSCPFTVKIFTPKAGEHYLIRLNNAGNRTCSLSIEYEDGSPVDAIESRSCEKRLR
jgi:hypothetical protein